MSQVDITKLILLLIGPQVPDIHAFAHSATLSYLHFINVVYFAFST